MSDTKIYFYKGKEEVLVKSKGGGDDATETDLLKKIQDAFTKVLDGKNLSFLLGCGCSSHMVEQDKAGGGKEKVDVGVPTMIPLAKEFYTKILSAADKTWLNDTLKLNVDADDFKHNLEKF